MVFSGYVAKKTMKFVMFPNEETRDLVLTGTVDSEADRFETARLTKSVEDIVEKYRGKEVVGMRTEIARSRRGGAVEENKFRSIIEIVPKEKRKKSADQLIEEFDAQIKELKGFKKLQFQKSRWGHSSGSPVEVVVQQNNDTIRALITKKLVKLMEEYPKLNTYLLKSQEIPPGKRVEIVELTLTEPKMVRADIANEHPAVIGKVYDEILLLWAALSQEEAKVPN